MDFSNLTFMICLPRSRSAWMVEFMRAHGVTAWHNPLQSCSRLEQLHELVRDRMSKALPGTRLFIADVAALFFYDKLVFMFPGAKFLFVWRSGAAVECSMNALGVKPPLNLRAAERQLQQAIAGAQHQRNTMAGPFEELDNGVIMNSIVQFVSGREMSSFKWDRMRHKNIQVSIADQRKNVDPVAQRQLFSQAHIVH